MAGTVERERAALKRRSAPGKHLRPEEAAALLDAQLRSGKTQGDFAKEIGRSTRSLSYWKTRFAREGTPRVPAAPPTPPAPRRPAPAPAPAFVPVRVQTQAAAARRADPGTGFALTLRDGARLEVPADFEGPALQRLVAALREVDAW